MKKILYYNTFYTSFKLCTFKNSVIRKPKVKRILQIN